MKLSARTPRPVAPIGRLIALLLLFELPQLAAQTAPTPDTAASTPVELSPFTVTTDKDVGFVAANSLSGGRTAGDLADTPASYTVQTREFLDALNLTSLDDAMEWAPNVSKFTNDNAAGIALGTDAVSSSTTRGFQSNPPLRNFFNVSYTLDAYNTERFDYMRGPNAILYGTGTLSGSANSMTKSALPQRTIDELQSMADSHGSLRVTADVNEPIGDKAALRLNLLDSDKQTFREGEHTRKIGLAPDLTVELTPTTEVRITSEYATDAIWQMISPFRDGLSGWDGTTFGLQSLAGSSTAASTYTIHGVQRLGSSTAPDYFIFGPGDTGIVNYAGTVTTLGYGTGMRALGGVLPVTGNLSTAGAPIIDDGFNLPAQNVLYGPALQDSNFTIPRRNFTNLGTAPVGTDRDRDLNVAFTQKVGDSLFFELAGDANKRHNYGNASYWYSDAVTGFGSVYLDVNQTTPTGAPNPEYLQPYQQAGLDRRFDDLIYKGAHLAGAYSHHWKWMDLKLATMVGVDDDQSIIVREIGVLPINADPRQWGLNNANSYPVYYRMYFNQSFRGPPPMGVAMPVVNPQTGTTTMMTPLWVLESSRGDGGITQQVQKTNYEQAAAQLSFFQKRLVILAAVRNDRLTSEEAEGLRAESYPAGFVPTFNNYIFRPDAPANWASMAPSRPLDANSVPVVANLGTQYQNDYNPPPIVTGATTMSVGAIARVGYGFAVTANYSQTFQPPALGNVTIDYGQPPPALSAGTELGVRYVLPGGKVSASLTHYFATTRNSNVAAPLGYTNINTVINTTAIGPSDVPGGTNSVGLGVLPLTWVDTANTEDHGYELDVTANLTQQWRLLANFGTANATQTGAYPQTTAWLTANGPTLIKILNQAGVVVVNNVASVPAGATASSTAVTGANAYNALYSDVPGWVSGQQLAMYDMKYTGNIFTDYTLAEGFLRGLRIGGGLQYRGPQVIGNRSTDTIPNPASPTTSAIANPNVSAYTMIWDHSYGTGTFVAFYPIKVARGQELDFNLSVTNVFDYHSPIYNVTGQRPYEANLASPARVRVPVDYTYIPPPTFTLSIDYKF